MLTNHIHCYHSQCKHFALRLRCYDTSGYEHCKFNPFRAIHEECPTIHIAQRVLDQANAELERMAQEDQEK